ALKAIMSKKTSKTDGPDADTQLFRDLMRDTTPLPDTNRRHQRAVPPKPRARSLEQDEADVMAGLLDHEIDPENFSTGEELEYRRPGVQDRVMRKLRKGQFSVQAELDLHGLTVAQARAELAGFLLHCQREGLRCVRIIHGKGLRSGPRGPVLKSKVALWLSRRDDVLAYCSARPVDGGYGALCVLFRSPGRR
ncbi:MAG: Smr/MutS family protein, partial [Nevskiales bacterium]